MKFLIRVAIEKITFQSQLRNLLKISLIKQARSLSFLQSTLIGFSEMKLKEWMTNKSVRN